jgi:3-hydroxyacyl-CoA dehydrogenase
MSDVAVYSVRDGIAVITMKSPPVNGLGNALRAGIAEGLKQAAADPEVKAVVIIGGSKVFSGGADIREFNKPMTPPNLPEVNDMQDAMQKPLVAAIGGFALGGGLELALGCHYRVALPKTLLGLPEVKLGILPGSGGTQRLPRLVPVHEAARMITLGDPIPAERAKEWGLVDEIVVGDLLEEAVAYAKKLVADGKGPRRVRDMAPRVDATRAAIQRRPRSPSASRPPSPCPSTKAARWSASASSTWSTPWNRRRCATCSSPSARPPRSPTCRTTRRCGTSARRRSSARAPWAAASP